MLLGVFAVIAASCSQSNIPSAVAFSDEPIVLSVWAWDGVIAESLIDEFEATHPGIRIEVANSSFDQHHNGLLNALIDDGTLPDVAAIERTYLPDFLAHSGQFVDLAGFGALDLESSYLQWRWDEGVDAEGRVIGLPTDTGGLALAYRTDLFEAAGLPFDRETVAERVSTWDGFLELGTEYVAANTGTSFVDGVDTLYRAHLGQKANAYVDGEGQVVIDTSVAETWDFVIEAVERDFSAGLPQFSAEWNDGFANSSFATIAAPSWMRGVIEANAPGSENLWSLVPVPGVGGNWGGSQLTAPAGDNEGEAAQFITFMTSVDTQRKLFIENSNFPSTPELYETDEITGWVDDFFGGQRVGEIYSESVEALQSQPTVPGQREIDLIFASGLSQFDLLGDETSEEIWQDARLAALDIIENGPPTSAE